MATLRRSDDELLKALERLSTGLKVERRDPGKICPDCKGSGEYVGFSVVDDCKTCHGTGRVYEDLLDDGIEPF